MGDYFIYIIKSKFLCSGHLIFYICLLLWPYQDSNQTGFQELGNRWMKIISLLPFILLWPLLMKRFSHKIPIIKLKRNQWCNSELFWIRVLIWIDVMNRSDWLSWGTLALKCHYVSPILNVLMEFEFSKSLSGQMCMHCIFKMLI